MPIIPFDPPGGYFPPVPYGGCLWPIDPGCRTEDWEGFETEVQARALAYASSTLERLTAFRVGVCPITLRPALSGLCNGPQSASHLLGVGYYPVNTAGVWTNCTAEGCTSHCEIDLPAPVTRIDEVKAHGQVINPTDYEVHNGHLLVWTGTGPCPWPGNQRMDLPDTEEGTMSVTYLNAYPVDELGANAVTLLALEFAKACTNKTCQLPPNVTSLVRQGVSMQIASGAFPEGLTGIRQVDTYIALWNPNKRTHGGIVYSPDQPQHRIVT